MDQLPISKARWLRADVFVSGLHRWAPKSVGRHYYCKELTTARQWTSSTENTTLSSAARGPHTRESLGESPCETPTPHPLNLRPLPSLPWACLGYRP